MMSNYSDELTCDMAETYGVFDIKRLPASLAATLAVGLGDNSRVKRAATNTKYSDEVILLASIADSLRWLKWAKTEDGAKGVNMPASILDIYLGRTPPEPEYETFDSPEEFWKRMDEITR